MILGEELLEPEVDLRRLAHRWAAWAEEDGREVRTWTRTALEHIRIHDSPPVSIGGQPDNGIISRCLPLALKSFRQPANLISGTYHTTMLTHPDEGSAWGAVAVNVTAACFLAGRRDFFGDVVEVLRENAAPPALLEAVRRVPRERREELAVSGNGPESIEYVVEIALWLAYHEPDLERGLLWLVNGGGNAASNAAVAGGLLGARDGEGALPERWIRALPSPERLRRLANRLVGGTTV